MRRSLSVGLLFAAVLFFVGCQPSDDIVGSLEAVEVGPAGFVKVTGWAIDESDPTTPLDVWVSDFNGGWYQLGPTETSRPDLYPFYGGDVKVGFDIAYVPALAGADTVCVRVVNNPKQTYKVLGCEPINVLPESLGGLPGFGGPTLTRVPDSQLSPECASGGGEATGTFTIRKVNGGVPVFTQSPVSIVVPSGYIVRAEVRWRFKRDLPIGLQVGTRADVYYRVNEQGGGTDAGVVGLLNFGSVPAGDLSFTQQGFTSLRTEGLSGQLDIDFQPDGYVFLAENVSLETVVKLTVVRASDGLPFCAPDCAAAGGTVYFAERQLVGGVMYQGCYDGSACNDELLEDFETAYTVASGVASGAVATVALKGAGPTARGVVGLTVGSGSATLPPASGPLPPLNPGSVASRTVIDSATTMCTVAGIL